ncbi:MAG: hypothetical protein DMG54_09650 [Acidobacteria bacterium]|nr:MAG: hypothetical protein DMG54_09650 [Acidobacteriota bacterium]
MIRSTNWAKSVVVLVLTLFFGGALCAQIDKATISGTVTDESGAVVPNVRVTATNVETGVRYAAQSNDSGIYRIAALPIGDYSLDFEKSGFKKLSRTGLNVATGQVAEIDVQMLIGGVAEVVQVNSDNVLLETETTSVGTLMTASALKDLPLDINSSGVGRDITSFIYSNVATTSGGNWVGHIGGSQDKSKNVLVDGVDATAGLQGFVQNIGMEAVQEMNVQISGTSAEGASTGGGTILLELKSGTNQLHGSAFGFLQNEALNANRWDNNFFGIPRQRSRFEDWGASAGGPIRKNHTFLFGAYERFHNVQNTFSPNTSTAPTNAFLNGDFSALLGGPLMINGARATDACGRPINIGEIYDPSNKVVQGNNTCYQPFPGNIIPQAQLSPIAMNIANKVYRNGYAPTGPGLINNFPAFTGVPEVLSTHLDLKLDHNINSKQRVSGAYNWWGYKYSGPGPGLWQTKSSNGGPLSSGDTQPQHDWSVRFQHFYTLSPTLLNTFSYVYNEHRAQDSPPSTFDAGKIGIPGTNGKNFPTMNFVDNGGAGVNGITETTIGPPYSDRYAYTNYVAADTVAWMRGRHNFKFGGDFQARGVNGLYDGGVRAYNFRNETFAPNDPAVLPFVGFAFANFMLGQVHDGAQSVSTALYGRRKHMSLFASDDFKVSRRLALNLGLRWDVNRRFHEKNGHWANFDIAANRGIWGNFNGGWDWAQNGDSSFEKNQNYHQFGPQLGAAYQLRNNLVLRGHYGITYSPLALNQWNGVPAFYPPGFTAGAFGFAGTNTVVNNIPFVPAFNWDTTSGAYAGTAIFPARVPDQSNISGGVAYVWPDALTMGMVQNWNLGAEYLLGKSTVFSLNYLANHGSHLHDGSIWPNAFPTQSTYLKLFNSGHVADSVTDPASAAAAGVAYPFPGFSGLAYQAITPYPQISSQAPANLFLVNAGLATSSYRALVAEVRSKDAHGLTMDLNYTFSRAEGTPSNTFGYNAFADQASGSVFTQDPYLVPKLTDTLAPWDHTHEVKGYVLYDLPFGSGKQWKTSKGWLNDYVLGGWTLGAQLSYHSGEPLGTVPAGTQYLGWSGLFAQRNSSVSLANPFKTLNLNWVANPNGPDSGSLFFNPSAFSQPAPGTFSSEQHSYMGYLRNWAWADEDLNIAKRFRFGPHERHYALSLRAQFFDVFNRHHWGTPNLQMNSPLFGHVTGLCSNCAVSNRYGQLGARFEW